MKFRERVKQRVLITISWRRKYKTRLRESRLYACMMEYGVASEEWDALKRDFLEESVRELVLRYKWRI